MREPCAQGKLHRLTQGNGILISLVPPRHAERERKKKEEEEEARQPALACQRRLDGTADGHLADFPPGGPRAALGCNFSNLISRPNRGARDRKETRHSWNGKKRGRHEKGELQLKGGKHESGTSVLIL